MHCFSHGVQGVASSNLVAPTNSINPLRAPSSGSLFVIGSLTSTQSPSGHRSAVASRRTKITTMIINKFSACCVPAHYKPQKPIEYPPPPSTGMVVNQFEMGPASATTPPRFARTGINCADIGTGSPIGTPPLWDPWSPGVTDPIAAYRPARYTFEVRRATVCLPEIWTAVTAAKWAAPKSTRAIGRVGPSSLIRPRLTI
jgi:hypothetical protein